MATTLCIIAAFTATQSTVRAWDQVHHHEEPHGPQGHQSQRNRFFLSNPNGFVGGFGFGGPIPLYGGPGSFGGYRPPPPVGISGQFGGFPGGISNMLSNIFGSFMPNLASIGGYIPGLNQQIPNPGSSQYPQAPLVLPQAQPLSNDNPAQVSGYAGECGVQSAAYQPGLISPNYRIVGGKEARPHSWPWMVVIQSASATCGGVLIRPDIVLTAAHCLQRGTAGTRVIVGAHSFYPNSNNNGNGGDGGFTVRAVGYLIHPGYDQQRSANDIAMLKLERPVPLSDQVKTICLPPAGQELLEGTQCVITGWGRLNENGRLPGVLEEANVQIVGRQICQQRLGSAVTDSMLCAGGGTTDSCDGDSGGPLVCQHGSRWFIHGVTSWGLGCGISGYPGAYSKVSSFTNWINDRIAHA